MLSTIWDRICMMQISCTSPYSRNFIGISICKPTSDHVCLIKKRLLYIIWYWNIMCFYPALSFFFLPDFNLFVSLYALVTKFFIIVHVKENVFLRDSFLELENALIFLFTFRDNWRLSTIRIWCFSEMQWRWGNAKNGLCFWNCWPDSRKSTLTPFFVTLIRCWSGCVRFDTQKGTTINGEVLDFQWDICGRRKMQFS